ncbi:guanine nucleotide-binding protein subunit alpha [Sorochytrium milnesiophthora]
MFCFSAAEPEHAQARKTSASIDRGLVKDLEKSKQEVKLLLLGAGGSGKSTIFKQMQLIYGSGFSDADRTALRHGIYQNVIDGLQKVLSSAAIIANTQPSDQPLDIAEEDQQALNAVAAQSSNGRLEALPNSFTQTALNISRSTVAQKVMARANEFQIVESTSYFMEHLQRIVNPNYLPTDQDILQMRIRTTAIMEKRYCIDGLQYAIIDVGGQRSERRKWLHCFESVTSIIFVIAVSEYDQVLEEDDTVNRLKESILLFGSICNSSWFAKIPLILFLNKTDLFAVKLRVSSPRTYFSSFPAQCKEPTDGLRFFKKLVQAVNKNAAKPVYTHFTCATDTQQIKYVLSAVRDIIVRSRLGSVGLV